LICQNGKVSKKASQLDDSDSKAFNELKDNLIAQNELVQPDYNNKYTITTDASDLAIGAVLSQEGQPITFISKTLTKTMVWGFKNLPNYLYGVNSTEIYTDHQPFSI